MLFYYDPPTSPTYTLSLHDALPIYGVAVAPDAQSVAAHGMLFPARGVNGGAELGQQPLAGHLQEIEAGRARDRKSTRLNSSHLGISYAVFCLKKKNKTTQHSFTYMM